MLLVKDIYIKGLLSNLVIIFLFAATIALSVVFLSLLQYNKEDAFINTLKSNNHYVLQLAKYIDYPREEVDPYTNEKYIENGPVVFYEKANMADIAKLKSIATDKATYYPSFFFEKNLHDFTSDFIYTDQTAFQFYARGFREMIAVDDFSSFHLQLLYGQKPQKTNEILIYDYMANNLLYYKLFNGDMTSIVGAKLIDQDTGLVLNVSGILKSDYTRYSYIDKDRNSHQFEETYLTSLQVIFCYPEFVELVAKENQYDSLFKCYFVNNSTQTTTNTNIKKAKYVNLENTKFLSTVENYEQERGVFVNMSTVAYLMRTALENVNEEIALLFLENYFVSGLDCFYDTSIERSYLIGFSHRILGVVVEGLTEPVLYCYTPNEDDFYMSNGEFRQIYLSLGTDWKANRATLKNFEFITHSDSFYSENPYYYYEGYTDYTSYGLLIRDADYYLNDVKDFSRIVEAIIICVSFSAMFLFAILTIKKNNYKIGVLKTMGASNGNISLIFGLQIFLTSIISYVLSIPLSFITMREINLTFVNRINSDLVFFSINPAAQGIILGFTILSVIIAASLPLINLYFRSPISIIKNFSKN
ncbi:MAG: ABC transporter permease [Christensenellaceae bacterium]|jgi:hypothetical protein|nr:ABC transporter permease [Christensenellaceae bacterium]